MLEQQIHSLQSKISQCPDGKLLCARNTNRCKWYISDGHSQTYLPKKNRKLAEQLAAKKYYTTLLKDLQAEKKATEQRILEKHNALIEERRQIANIIEKRQQIADKI